MPEHPKERLKFERRLQQLLRRCNKKMRTRLISSMGHPKDPRNIPEYIWKQVERECASDPLPLLARIFGFAFAALLTLTGFIVAREKLRTSRAENEQRTRERLEETAKKRIERIRQKLEKRRIEAEEKEERVDWGEELDKQIGLPKDKTDPPTSAEERVACTETTQQISSGEQAYIGHVEAEVALEFERIWNIEPTGACPICHPLHRTNQGVWRPVSPGGPPAHPFCRCWLTYRANRKVTGVPEREIGLE